MNELIEAHVGYAHAIAADLINRFPSWVTRDELESAAELGLVQAARSYDPSRGIAFTSFAYYRIRGAIFDEMRRFWQASKFEVAANDYMTDQTETANPDSSDANKVLRELEGITSQIFSSYLLSLDRMSLDRLPDQKSSPASYVLQKEDADKIRKALRRLPERYRLVLHAYYYDDLSFGAIGKRLKLSRPWVCRLHAKGLSMIKEILEKQDDQPSHQQPCTPQNENSRMAPFLAGAR